MVDQDDHCRLNRVSLSLRRGEILGVVGRNGSGKSSLLQLIAGGLSPTRGRIQLRGEEQTKNQSLLRESVVLFAHGSGEPVSLSFTAWQEYGAFVHGAELGLIRSRLNEYREWLPSSNTRMDKLSVGSRRRVELAFGFCRRAPIYCLDQATDSIDGLTQRQLGAQIKVRASEGTTFVIADHSAEFISSLCDRVVVMSEGGIDRYLQRDEPEFREQLLVAQGWKEA